MINFENLIKYLLLFLVVTSSTYYIPSCNIINKHAIYIGLLASTTFVLLDKMFPHVIETDCSNHNCENYRNLNYQKY